MYALDNLLQLVLSGEIRNANAPDYYVIPISSISVIRSNRIITLSCNLQNWVILSSQIARRESYIAAKRTFRQVTTVVKFRVLPDPLSMSRRVADKTQRFKSSKCNTRKIIAMCPFSVTARSKIQEYWIFALDIIYRLRWCVAELCQMQ